LIPISRAHGVRYLWNSRLPGNGLIETYAVLAPFAREVLECASANGQRPALIVGQTHGG
jgi:hypothetical protein